MRALCVFGLVGSLLCALEARSEGIVIDSREYKLSLNAATGGIDPAAIWTRHVVPAIEKALRNDDGSLPKAVPFGAPETRRVRFWDTAGCTLSLHDFVLRERTPMKGDQPDPAGRKFTLKLRSTDLFQAANTRILESEGKTKLEEDIVLTGQPGERLGTRSQFSASVPRSGEGDAFPATFSNVLALFPELQEELRDAHVAIEGQAAMKGGRIVREVVHSDAEVPLGKKAKATFDLTVWYADPPGSAATVAELSFKYKTNDGEVSEAVARRGRALFFALAGTLGPLRDPDPEPKTPSALPEECRAAAR